MNFSDILAHSAKRERQKLNISISALAKKAGIAKSTLSQIEAAKGNPSVETLWLLAGALNIPLSNLLEQSSRGTSLVRASEGTSLISDETSYGVAILSPSIPNSRRDLYRIDLGSKSARTSTPHPAGAIEHAFVCAGAVKIGPVDSIELLYPGDYYSYPADVPHHYESVNKESVIMLIIETIR